MSEQITSRPVVQARGVSKRFGVTVALENLSIDVLPRKVHALVGRNGAGKSTLVSVLTGLVAPDAGAVLFDGEPAPPLADREAWRRRVACVYQRSTVIRSLSVAENLFLNRQNHVGGSPGRRRGLISWPAVRREARELLATWGEDVDVRLPAGELGVEQRQLVEIIRALSLGSRFIILDEPTAQLDAHAIERLFARMRALRAQGVTFLFISHHLDEVYQVCDTVTVLRDARHIVTAPVAELAKADLVAAMTGEATGLIAAPSDRPGRPDRTASDVPALRVTGLSLPGSVAEVSFEVAQGEMVGLAGGGGSGKIELAECLVGLRQPAAGTVAVGGRRPRPGSVSAAVRAGLGFLPQDRHRQGLVPELSVAENATLTVLDRLGRFGFVNPKLRSALGARFSNDLAIKAASQEQPVSALSGGNQQKVVMARALANRPKALVLVQPTAGVDVRAKETLLRAAAAAVDRGAGVLVVSDDLDDLRPCDRVIVLFKGVVVAELAAGWSDHELIAVMEGVSADD